jgi:hypothetical protein
MQRTLSVCVNISALPHNRTPYVMLEILSKEIILVKMLQLLAAVNFSRDVNFRRKMCRAAVKNECMIYKYIYKKGFFL